MVTCFCHSPLHEYLPSCDTAGHIPRKLKPNAGNCRNSFSFMFVSRNNIHVQGHDFPDSTTKNGVLYIMFKFQNHRN